MMNFVLVLKGGGLHAAVEVSKVSKNSKLDRRYLVLTDTSLVDVSKNDEFRIKNEKLCIKNEEFCIKNDEFRR